MMETTAKVNLEGVAVWPAAVNAMAAQGRVASCAAPAMVRAVSSMVPPLSDPFLSTKLSALRRWLPLVLLGAAFLIVVAMGAHRMLSLETIVENKARLEGIVEQNRLAALGAFMAIYIAIIALSVPGSLIMTITGAILFPLWISAPATVISATVGATVVFLIARTALGESLRARGGDALFRISEGIRRDAASYMLFLRLVPLFPFALVNLAPALVGVPLRTFVWTTFVGIIPASFAFSFAAGSLGGLLDEKVAALEACRIMGQSDCRLAIDASMLVSPRLLLAFAALGLLALIPVIARRLGFGREGRHG